MNGNKKTTSGVSSPEMDTSHFAYNRNDNKHLILDVFGPTLQFLLTPEEAGGSLCILKTTLPSSLSVPLHSHNDVECFYMVSGQLEVLIETQEALTWMDCRPGDFVSVPGGTKHAFRNRFSEPAIAVCSTTAKLGQFFEEIGRPFLPGHYAGRGRKVRANSNALRPLAGDTR